MSRAQSYIEQLAQLLHVEDGMIAMFEAYCDESYGGDIKTTPYYIVAGFFGPSKSWRTFERLWTETMREFGIADIGLHAAKCSNGAKPYNRLRKEIRDEIQRRMAVDICASKPLMGLYAAIDMNAFTPNRKATFGKFFGKDYKKYSEPHIFALNSCVMAILEVTEKTQEKIAFVFDRNNEFSGRAHEWYQSGMHMPYLRTVQRLGPYAEDDRMSAVGLQAADMLAYEAYRHLADNRQRWQWKALNDACHIIEFMNAEDVWSDMENFTKDEKLQEETIEWAKRVAMAEANTKNSSK